MFSRMKLALEERSDGVATVETEHVFYARGINLADLQHATSMERQEQWDIKIPKTDENAVDGSVRIRMTVVKGQEPEFVITTKTRNAEGSKIEVSVPTTAANFAQFKQLSRSGMRKDRYCFPIEGSSLLWEVDMYLTEDNKYAEWCKIDLEVPDFNTPIPALPLVVDEIIGSNAEGRTAEQEAKVRWLYDNVFVTKNLFIGK